MLNKKNTLIFSGIILVFFLFCFNAPSYMIKKSGLTEETHPFSVRVVREYFEPLNRTFRKRGPSVLGVFFLLEQKALQGQKEFLIVETGSLRAEPINIPEDGASTLIFDHFFQVYKGSLHTVDLDPKCKDIIQKYCSSHTVVHTGDSVQFLKNFKEANKIDVLYLDSYDLNWDNPEPSAQHHLKEIKAIFPRLKKGTIIVVDDNFTHNGKPIGKGYLVEKFLKEKGVPLIYDGYQKVFQISPNPEDLSQMDQVIKMTSSRIMKRYFDVRRLQSKIAGLFFRE